MPQVSVLMVFHQITPFFEPAVRSVLEQTLGDLELVLVDNGTGLGLAPLGAAGRDPRIRLLALPENRGIAVGHNHAVAHARGEYIALLDYDDLARPTRLERQVAALEAHREIDLVSSQADTIDEGGRIVGHEFSLLQSEEQAAYTRFAPPVVTPAYAGRREIFVRFPYRPEFRLCGDFDALARMAEAVVMAGVPEVLLQYRHYPAQSSMAGRATRYVEECIIRLLTARRRAGRDEEFVPLLEEMRGWQETPPLAATLYAAFARRFLREGFPPMAVYHARKLLAVRRDGPACLEAVRVVVGALRAAPREVGSLLRLFFRGPVRALGLRPA
jgi:glycosyltransferase involved in cell wall biosynthesis